MATRREVLSLFKRFLYVGRDWPQGYQIFAERAKTVFRKNAIESDPDKIRELVGKGEFVLREIEALYKLKKYRTMKRRYYD